ncbi:hypothetical protein EB118_21455 [bacterium]|nr:hypothetical protein [bacterium]NDD83649.1 hypothetical protein [bacterium]NDG32626.1 hypothetical protein [bacterium]
MAKINYSCNHGNRDPNLQLLCTIIINCKAMENYTELNNKYTELNNKYTELNNKYTELQKEHTNLQHNYSENTIIQSMNDMKKRYDDLVSQTVPLYRYEHSQKSLKHIQKKCSAINYFLEHVLKQLKKLDSFLPPNNENNLYKIQFEIITIMDMLEQDN